MRKESRNPSGRMAPRVVAWGLSALLVLSGAPAIAFASEAGEVGVASDQTEVAEETAGAQAQETDGQAVVEQPSEVVQPVEEVAVEGQAPATDAQGLEEGTAIGEAEAPAEPEGLEAQAVTQRTLALNGQWTTFNMPGVGTQNGFIFYFTLSKPSLVKLDVQNWRNWRIYWQLWNGDLTTQYWSRSVGYSSPSTDSDYCYLREGTYALRLYPQGEDPKDGGQVKLKGSATAVGYPTRNNDTFDTAVNLAEGANTKALFTRNDTGSAYYKFTVPSKRTLKVTCTECDANIGTVSNFFFYNKSRECMQKDWLGNDVGNSVPVVGNVEHEFAAGTYFIKVTRDKDAGGPYTIKWETVDKGAANGGGANQGGGNGGAGQAERTPRVSYRTHVQRVGWQPFVADGDMSGTTGRSLRLEGINVKLSDLPCAGGISYRTHVQRIGWQGWRADGQMAGTSGMSRRLEAIEIKLTGELANRYDVYYRVHCQRFGWMGWAKNGERSGSAGYSRRLEGIQVVLVRKGQPAPGATYRGVTQRYATPFRQR